MVLNVAINAEISQLGRNGGLEAALIGLISALGRLQGEDEHYTIIAPRENPDWLRPYLGPNQELAFRPQGKPTVARKIRSLIRPPFARPTDPLISSGFHESLGCDIIHFPYQHFEISSMRAVYTPHDLQHLHHPEFFTPFEIARRETMYRSGCQLSRKITVGSEWVKKDIVRNYATDPEKIEVITWAPPTQAYPEPTERTIAQVMQRFDLKPGFVLYPAVTWPHKNHLRLLEAMALIRDQHAMALDLVCTGHQSSYFSNIADKRQRLGLERQVKFLGMVPGESLRALYRSARFVIVPTLFEAVSGPVYEAWLDQVPVACSAVTSLPEQAGSAALLFDPLSVEEIAKALITLQQDEEVRNNLIARGAERLGGLSWEATATRYRSLYRAVAGLTDVSG